MSRFYKSDISRNQYMLKRGLAKCGYDWWWHSFTAVNAETNEEKPFFIEFFICNPKYRQDVPIYGQLDKSNNVKPSYLMIKAGTWGKDAKQLHRFFGINKVTISSKVPFEISADDCFLSETQTYGHISIDSETSKNHPEMMCDSGEIEWNIKIDKKIPFNVGYGASKLFRELQLFEMFWHAEGMKTLYEGEIYYNGTKYKIVPEKCFGYADKNWGKDFTSPWVWLSSNNLKSSLTGKPLNNSVFDIGGGRPKIGPIALNRKLLSAFYYEGKCFEFDFSKFWTKTKTTFYIKETKDKIIWHVEQCTWRNKMVVDAECNKSEMLFINYESPKGEKKHNKLWNGGNGKAIIKLYSKGKLIDEIEALNLGCEYGEFDK